MATRNYFTLKCMEADDPEPYIGSHDILVEAFHDGYFNDMVNDIKQIPLRLYNYLIATNNFKLQMYIDKIGTKEEFLRLVNSIGLVDLTWDAILELLQITYYGKYQRIEEGVLRYGSPISFKDSLFSVEADFDRTSSKVKITVDNEVAGREEEELEELGFKNNVFEFDLIAEFLEIIYQNHKQITPNYRDGLISIYEDELKDKNKTPEWKIVLLSAAVNQLKLTDIHTDKIEHWVNRVTREWESLRS